MIVDFEGELRDFILLRNSFSIGNINEDLTFEYGDGTEVHHGCGVTFQNEFWYFGGTYPNNQQVNFFHLWMTYNLFI